MWRRISTNELSLVPIYLYVRACPYVPASIIAMSCHNQATRKERGRET